MLVFPEMAIGVKPDLVRVWWMLRGNVLRLILTIIMTTAPAFFLNAIGIVVYGAFSLLILGLWACTLSICYFHITGRQLLSGDTEVVAEDP